MCACAFFSYAYVHKPVCAVWGMIVQVLCYYAEGSVQVTTCVPCGLFVPILDQYRSEQLVRDSIHTRRQSFQTNPTIENKNLRHIQNQFKTIPDTECFQPFLLDGGGVEQIHVSKIEMKRKHSKIYKYIDGAREY